MIAEILYNVKLSSYQEILLTVIQTSEFGVYATFDLYTEYCVIDNCANVHIWNDI